MDIRSTIQAKGEYNMRPEAAHPLNELRTGVVQVCVLKLAVGVVQ